MRGSKEYDHTVERILKLKSLRMARGELSLEERIETDLLNQRLAFLVERNCEGVARTLNKRRRRMKKNILTLKAGVEELSSSLGEEIDELWMNEGAELYGNFGKKYGATAFAIYQDFQYTFDLRMDMHTISNRCRHFDKGMDDVEFWEDLAVIVSMYQALEKDGYFQKETL